MRSRDLRAHPSSRRPRVSLPRSVAEQLTEVFGVADPRTAEFVHHADAQARGAVQALCAAPTRRWSAVIDSNATARTAWCASWVEPSSVGVTREPTCIVAA